MKNRKGRRKKRRLPGSVSIPISLGFMALASLLNAIVEATEATEELKQLPPPVDDLKLNHDTGEYELPAPGRDG